MLSVSFVCELSIVVAADNVIRRHVYVVCPVCIAPNRQYKPRWGTLYPCHYNIYMSER